MIVAVPSAHNRWMLVVEDNPDDEMLATRVFKQSGRSEEFVTAHDGEHALRILRDRQLPALVLLDLKLPRLSGIELLTAIRDDERLCSIPVVVLTSSSETADVAACYALGCNAFVRKEVDYQRYINEVGATMEFWLSINCLPPFEPVHSI